MIGLMMPGMSPQNEEEEVKALRAAKLRALRGPSMMDSVTGMTGATAEAANERLNKQQVAALGAQGQIWGGAAAGGFDATGRASVEALKGRAQLEAQGLQNEGLLAAQDSQNRGGVDKQVVQNTGLEAVQRSQNAGQLATQNSQNRGGLATARERSLGDLGVANVTAGSQDRRTAAELQAALGGQKVAGADAFLRNDASRYQTEAYRAAMMGKNDAVVDAAELARRAKVGAAIAGQGGALMVGAPPGSDPGASLRALRDAATEPGTNASQEPPPNPKEGDQWMSPDGLRFWRGNRWSDK